MDTLIKRLKQVGSARWEAIAEAAGVAKSLPRKIAYGDRENPGVNTIQPLLNYFNLVDSGKVELPEAPASEHGELTEG